VQTEDYASARDLFRKDYAYFSSTSFSWLEHAAKYCSNISNLLKLDAQSFVVEIASNDGYLLKNFVARQIPCLGIEPTTSTADAAEAVGVPVWREFFGFELGCRLSREGKKADLLIGNNVFAHVPDINDFTRGLKEALKSNGVITLEFPHLLCLIQNTLFDTVYHEHFSYLSLYTVNRIFNSYGLRIWDVEELPTHGGSLRIYGCHESDSRTTSPRVAAVLEAEEQGGLRQLSTYGRVQERAVKIKNDLLEFLIKQRRDGKEIVAYGAAAKGNTLLNFAGIGSDLISVVYDAASAKQGKFLPGSHIPILSPDRLIGRRPNLVVILPWNLRTEVTSQLKYIRDWGGQFVVALPSLECF